MITVNEIYSLKTPQFTDQWKLEFITADSSFTIKPQMVSKVTLPIGIPSLEVKELSNSAHIYSGWKLDKNFSITLLENKNFEVFDYFKKWIDSIFDSDKQEFKEDFFDIERSAIFTFYHIENGKEHESKSWKLENVKILKFPESLQLSYTSSEVLDWTIDFICDSVIVN